MTYTPNVPQGNQTFPATQPLIEANFGYLNTALQKDHTFNGNAIGSEAPGYHQQASMPNITAPSSLPTGINGIYSVNSSTAGFYDGTNNYQMNIWTNVLKGTFSSTSSFTNVVAIPANTFGVVYFYNITGSTSSFLSCSGQFISNATAVDGFSNAADAGGSSFPIELNNFNNALFLQAKGGSTRYQGISVNYLIFYRPS